MLVLSRKDAQSIMIGHEIEIEVIEVKGSRVKIGIKAPTGVRILRKEVTERDNCDDSLDKLA